MRDKIAIIDYGVGNVHSVRAALNFLGYRNDITHDHADIRRADALVLPGVGAFGEAMDKLKSFGLLDILHDEVATRKKPIFGICLGMQILGNSSEESPGSKGLGLIDFDVKKIPSSGELKVPHVGWNNIHIDRWPELFKNLEHSPHFYFDHSFYADSNGECTLATCEYGNNLAAMVVKDNIVGVQFHPEKSQQNGLKLFRNYFNHLGFARA